MKRKLSTTESGRVSGRRQPQISCDFCRSKKLKCDRGAPCTNCSVRGLECGTPSDSVPKKKLLSPSSQQDGSIQARAEELSVLARLKRLESAMFGDDRSSIQKQNGLVETSDVPLVRDALPLATTSGRLPGALSALDAERQQQVRSLDSSFSSQDTKMALKRASVRYQVTGTPSSLSSATQSPLDEAAAKGGLPINMMTRDEAILLVHDFSSNPQHLLPILHEPTVRSIVHKVYDNLSIPGSPPSNPAHVALIFSIGAMCASYYREGCTISSLFPSEVEANEATTVWLESAMDLFDHSQRAASYCIEDVQSRIIISYVFYNMEGCSARFRFLQNSAVGMARDLGLHLVDSPTMKASQDDDEATKEIKRRLWWYVATTDWMLGFMGGPTEGIYTIQPRHMRVNHIRNINNKDLDSQEASFTRPETEPTEMSFLIQRTRLGEICRLALDARSPGSPHEEQLEIESALYLDGVFDKFLAELPPFFQPGSPAPQNAPAHLEIQRDTILIAILSRWARMHRSYLLRNHSDPRARPLRERCLSSARTVVSLGAKLLGIDQAGSQGTQLRKQSLAYRTGCIVGHLSMACTMLALKSSPGPGDVEDGTAANCPVILEELRQACRALTYAGKRSPIAASLVRNLMAVLRQCGAPGSANTAAAVPLGGPPHAPPPAGMDQDRLPEEAATVRLPDMPPPLMESNGVGVMTMPPPPPQTPMNVQVGEQDGMLLNEMGWENDGLWADLINTMGSTESWVDVFAGLDSFCGPA